MIDTYYNEPGVTPLNRGLFAFASYNAGPARVAGLRREAAAQGLDPDKWFNNVELIAAKRIGRETVTYVANIYKYYLAYQMLVQQSQARAQAKAAAGAAPAPTDGG
jgi:membrane-bound lytic murein transglycosylase MltF